MEETIKLIAGLGDNALTAFIIYEILDTVQLFVLFGLVTWGLSSVWKVFKKHEWGEYD